MSRVTPWESSAPLVRTDAVHVVFTSIENTLEAVGHYVVFVDANGAKESLRA